MKPVRRKKPQNHYLFSVSDELWRWAIRKLFSATPPEGAEEAIRPLKLSNLRPRYYLADVRQPSARESRGAECLKPTVEASPSPGFCAPCPAYFVTGFKRRDND
jgi:hypothetical protein